jgi:putative colanic acid biosysnthesis UDP-glucose lipid carrier transferase
VRTERRARGGVLRSHENLVGALQRIVDSAWIVLVHVVACWAYRDVWRPAMTTATALAVITFIFVAEFRGLYRPWRAERLGRETWETFATWLFVPPILFFLAFITKTSTLYSRAVTTGWFLLAPLALCGWRLALRLVLRNLRAKGRNTRRVAILGATEGAEKLGGAITERPWLGLDLVGVYDDRSEARRHSIGRLACPYLGRIEHLVKDARQGKIDAVYIALPLRAETRVGEVLRQLADTTATVYLMADFFTFDLLHARWSQLGEVPLVSIYDSPFHGEAGWLKRLEDIVLGTLILTLISVPMLLIAAAVKLTSPGPVLFRQRRYGLNGKEIRILKFRTMSVCEDGPTIKQAARNDPRVTRLGAFLRRTSLDELPQFLQVLTGEMSIVGPRPHAVAHNEQYRALIHGYMLRHKVKPGITGWAQVNGWRGETDELEKMQQRVQHDLEYIQNWDLFLDLKIIFLTLFGTKQRRNAY